MDTALHLAENVGNQGAPYVHDAVQSGRLEAAASNVKHKQLPAALRSGVGFHYAAMEQEDRATVEQLFLDRLLPVSLPGHSPQHNTGLTQRKDTNVF